MSILPGCSALGFSQYLSMLRPGSSSSPDGTRGTHINGHSSIQEAFKQRIVFR